MSFETIIPENPVVLASPYAESVLYRSDKIADRPEDREMIGVLDGDAQIYGFLNNPYFIETSRGLSIPVELTPDSENKVKYISFNRLAFEGIFKCFSNVQIGRIIGAKSVRALCLAFDNVTLLPYFEELPDDHLLHVPVLAVGSIDRTA